MLSSTILSLVALAPSALAAVLSSSGCPPDVTITAVVQYTTVATVTTTVGTTSISYVFLPGQPPAAPRRRADPPPGFQLPNPPAPPAPAVSTSAVAVVPIPSVVDTPAAAAAAPTTTKKRSPCKGRQTTSSVPTTSGAPSTSAAPTSSSTLGTTSCSPPVIVAVTRTAIASSTTTLTVALAPLLTTVYPCATPLVNNRGPTYGDAVGAEGLNTQGNSLYGLNTPQGASAEACCNTCFFGTQNCIQAYWYSYQGCVVSRADNLTRASGSGVSAQCPAGTFNGLSYDPDTRPAFRSTGNIAGPCGQRYNNL